jgi:transcription elongation factor
MINEANLLLNNEVRINIGRFAGRTGIVNKVMADGRTLDVTLFGCDKVVFIDVTLVGEVREPTQYAKTEQSLGPDANSVLPVNRL